MTQLTDKEVRSSLVELAIRFDTAPKMYTKQDYNHLIRCIAQVYEASNNFDIMSLLQDVSRIVNSTKEPSDDLKKEGYSWLNLETQRMITYLDDKGTFREYIPREGDYFLVLDELKIYHVKKSSGSTIIEGSELSEKDKWELI